jgi:hypothetical protein
MVRNRSYGVFLGKLFKKLDRGYEKGRMGDDSKSADNMPIPVEPT